MTKRLTTPMAVVLWCIAASAGAYAVERWAGAVEARHVVEAWWALVVGVLVLVAELWAADRVSTMKLGIKPKGIVLSVVLWNAALLVAGSAVLLSAAGAVVAWRWL